MSLAYKRFTVYLRVGLVLTVVLLAAIVLFKNRNHSVRLWFFGLTDPEQPTNVVWVMLWTVAITRAAWWLISFGRGMIRDLREVRRQNAIEQSEQERRTREASLQARERQLDEKLKQVGGAEGSDGEGTRPAGVREGEAT